MLTFSNERFQVIDKHLSLVITAFNDFILRKLGFKVIICTMCKPYVMRIMYYRVK